MKDCSGMKADAGKESMMNFSHFLSFFVSFFSSFSCHFLVIFLLFLVGLWLWVFLVCNRCMCWMCVR